MYSLHIIVSFVSESFFSSNDWTLGTQGGTTLQAIQANFQTWLSGPQTTGLIVLEHELTNDSVQAFMNAYPLMKQYNWNLKSTVTVNATSGWFNSNDDTSQPVPLPLTAAGNGGAGLIAATSTSSSTSTPPPSPTSSASSSKSSAGSNAKKSGAAPGLSSSPIIMMVTTLALAFSLYLI
jgi:chitin deacetylase